MNRSRIAGALLALLLGGWAHAEEPDHAVHQELRQLLATVREAVNSGHYDDIKPVSSEQLRLTTITQEFVKGRDGIPGYFSSHFGPGKKLKSLKMDWQVDALTELSPDKSWGLAYGNGTEDYTLNDGRTYHIPTRWTATVAKDPDNKWRIRSMHIGTDFLNNPILSEVEAKAKQYAILAALAGLCGGGLIGFLVGRRRS